MWKLLNKIVALTLTFALFFEQAGFAQVPLQIQIPSYIGGYVAADRFRPVQLRSLSFDSSKQDFNLFLDQGDEDKIDSGRISREAKQLMQYFRIGLALPNETFWVNLRPDAADQIIDPFLEKTDVGRIMLATDLQLKKDLACFTSPKNEEGRQYWDKLYSRAQELFGAQEISIPTLTRPWIVPGEIFVRETGSACHILKASLKVCLEQDHLKDSKAYNFVDQRLKELNDYSSQLVRELILPKLTREVNSSKKYAGLRQVYYSLILAQWFKEKHQGQQGEYSRKINGFDLNGLTSSKPWKKEKYFNAYKKSFKKGEYNISENRFTSQGASIRQYFSGGEQIVFAPGMIKVIAPDGAGLNLQGQLPAELTADLIEILADGKIIIPQSPYPNELSQKDGGTPPGFPGDNGKSPVAPVRNPDDSIRSNMVPTSTGAAKGLFKLMPERVDIRKTRIYGLGLTLALGAAATIGASFGMFSLFGIYPAIAVGVLGAVVLFKRGGSIANVLTDKVVFRLMYGETLNSYLDRAEKSWSKYIDIQAIPREDNKDGGDPDQVQSKPENIILRPFIALWKRIYYPGQVKKYIKVLEAHKVARSESERAAEMLGKLEDQAAIKPLTDYLVQVVLADDYDAAPAAEKALRQLGRTDSDIERIYLDAFFNTQNHPLVRLNAIEILGKKSGRSESLKELLLYGKEIESPLAALINRATEKAGLRILRRVRQEGKIKETATAEAKQDGGRAEIADLEELINSKELMRQFVDKFVPELASKYAPGGLIDESLQRVLREFKKLEIIDPKLISNPTDRHRAAQAIRFIEEVMKKDGGQQEIKSYINAFCANSRKIRAMIESDKTLSQEHSQAYESMLQKNKNYDVSSLVEIARYLASEAKPKDFVPGKTSIIQELHPEIIIGQVIPYLKNKAKSETPYIQEVITEALPKINTLAKESKNSGTQLKDGGTHRGMDLYESEAVGIVIKKLKSESSSVREKTARQLGEMNAKQAIEDLKQALKIEKVRSARNAMAYALAKIDKNYLIDLLEGNALSPDARNAAEMALSDLKRNQADGGSADIAAGLRQVGENARLKILLLSSGIEFKEMLIIMDNLENVPAIFKKEFRKAYFGAVQTLIKAGLRGADLQHALDAIKGNSQEKYPWEEQFFILDLLDTAQWTMDFIGVSKSSEFGRNNQAGILTKLLSRSDRFQMAQVLIVIMDSLLRTKDDPRLISDILAEIVWLNSSELPSIADMWKNTRNIGEVVAFLSAGDRGQLLQSSQSAVIFSRMLQLPLGLAAVEKMIKVGEENKIEPQETRDLISTVLYWGTDAANPFGREILENLAQKSQKDNFEFVSRLLEQHQPIDQAGREWNRYQELSALKDFLKPQEEAQKDGGNTYLEVPDLVKALTHEKSSIRHGAAKELEKSGELTPERELIMLVEDLSDIDGKVRRDAADKLAGSNKLTEELKIIRYVADLSDPDRDVRLSAAFMLGEIGNPQTLEPLLLALKDHDKFVCKVAVASLGKLKNPKAAPALLELLDEPDKDLRSTAAEALGELVDSLAIAHLEKIRDDKIRDFLTASSEELKNIIETKAVKQLIKTLADEDKEVREAATQALGKIADPLAVDALIELLDKDPYLDVVRAAVVSLGEIGDPRAISALHKSLAIFQPEDRYQVALALQEIVHKNKKNNEKDGGNEILWFGTPIEVPQELIDQLKVAWKEILATDARLDIDEIIQQSRQSRKFALLERTDSAFIEANQSALNDIIAIDTVSRLVSLTEKYEREAVRTGLERTLESLILEPEKTYVKLALEQINLLGSQESNLPDGGKAMVLGDQWQKAWADLQQALLSRTRLPESEWQARVEEAQKKAGVIAGGISQARQFKEQQPVTMAELQRERVYISATKSDRFGNPRVFSGEEIIARYGSLSPDFTGMEEAVKALSLRDVIAVLQEMGQMEKPRQYNDSGVSLRDGGDIQEDAPIARKISTYAQALIAGELLKSLSIHSNRYELESVTDAEKDFFDKIKGTLIVGDLRKRGRYIVYKTDINHKNNPGIKQNNPILQVSSDKGESRSFSAYYENGWRVYSVNPSTIMLDCPLGQFKIYRRAQYKVRVEKWDGVISGQSLIPEAAAQVAAQDGGFRLSDYPSLRIDDIFFRADELFKREKDPADKEITKLAAAKIFEIGVEAYPILKKRLNYGSINERHKGIAQEALKMLESTYQLGKDGGSAEVYKQIHGLLKKGIKSAEDEAELGKLTTKYNLEAILETIKPYEKYFKVSMVFSMKNNEALEYIEKLEAGNSAAEITNEFGERIELGYAKEGLKNSLFHPALVSIKPLDDLQAKEVSYIRLLLTPQGMKNRYEEGWFESPHGNIALNRDGGKLTEEAKRLHKATVLRLYADNLKLRPVEGGNPRAYYIFEQMVTQALEEIGKLEAFVRPDDIERAVLKDCQSIILKGSEYSARSLGNKESLGKISLLAAQILAKNSVEFTGEIIEALLPVMDIIYDGNSGKRSTGWLTAELLINQGKGTQRFLKAKIESGGLNRDRVDQLKQVLESMDKSNKDGGIQGDIALLFDTTVKALEQQPLTAPGGIDFRALPVVTSAVNPNAGALMPKVSLNELDGQWKEIQRVAQNAELPYAQMKQFVSCCKAQEEAAGLKQEVAAYVVNLLKLEEERAIATPEALKEIVALVAA